MNPDAQIVIEQMELTAALDEVKKIIPVDWATRWTVQIDGPRMASLAKPWDVQYGKGPSLVAALLDLKRRLEI